MNPLQNFLSRLPDAKRSGNGAPSRPLRPPGAPVESAPMRHSRAPAPLAIALLVAATLRPEAAPALSRLGAASAAISAAVSPGADATPVVSIAQWNGRREILGVLGSGAPRGASVEILDAESGLPLATATADQRGRFVSWLRMEAPDAPCSVRARVADLVGAPRRVDRGPARCRPPRA